MAIRRPLVIDAGNVKELPDGDSLQETSGYPVVRPSLLLDFANSKRLDPRIDFTRASAATYYGADGLLKYAAVNEPRIDHDPFNGVCRGLLIEDARTNHSRNTYTSGSVSNIGTGTATAPDGTFAKKVTPVVGVSAFPGVGNTSSLAVALTNGQSQDIAVTGYFAAGTSGIQLEPMLLINYYTAPNLNNAFGLLQINTATMTVRSKTVNSGFSEVIAPLIELQPCGMYKLTWVLRFTQDATIRDTMYTAFHIRDTAGSGTFTGDGVGHFQYWGLQTEFITQPTSYIPTTTTPATRSADVATMTGTNFSDWYRPDEGTLLRVFTPDGGLTPAVAGRMGTVVSDGTGANMIAVRCVGATSLASSYADATITAASVVQADFIGYTGIGLVYGTEYKQALAYKLNNSALSTNGSIAEVDTVGTIPTVNRIELVQAAGSAVHLARIAYYPKRLSNTELQALSTI